MAARRLETFGSISSQMSHRTHQDWSTPSFDLEPTAPAVGPFPRREFLVSAFETLDGAMGEPLLLDSGEGLVALARSPGLVSFAGSSDLTDYHAPVGSGIPDLLAGYLGDLPAGTRLELDSLPGEAVELVVAGVAGAGMQDTCEEHTVTAVVELPGSFDEYLSRIGKKQRHELRRKRRRYIELVGRLSHETHRGLGWAFDEFIRLHRLSDGEKGEFMTDTRAEFFARLASTPGWRIDVLRVPGTDRASACLFSYSDLDAYYLYNSAYDPALADASPGVAIVGSMVEQAIEEGVPRFDFLKGDEAYKFRLGATRRPLYRVRAKR